MITEPARRLFKAPIEATADALARLGITPNGLTIVGASMHLFVLLALARGDFQQGALLLLVACGIDGVDGTLARRTGRSSSFGAFLDSTLDRVSEILVFLGLLLFSQTAAGSIRPGGFAAWLVYLALCGSLMVSYSRARAEGAGLGTRAGIFGRLERMTVLWLGLISGWVAAALWVVAVGAWVTTGQRVLDVWRLSRTELRPAEARPETAD